MLAQLAVTDDEVAGWTEELNDILAYAEQVGEVAADDVPPTTHPYPLANVFRDDEVGPVLDRDQLLAGGPETTEGRFVVPRIVEEPSPDGPRHRVAEE